MKDFTGVKFDYDHATEEERREFFEWAWYNSPLDEEEQWYEDHADEFVPCENQEEMRRQLMEAAHNTMEEIRTKKSAPLHTDQDAYAFRPIAMEG